VSFSAGASEEIVYRLGLMTLLAWLGTQLVPGHRGQPRAAVVWTANVLAALVFGVSHLYGAIPFPRTLTSATRVVAQNTALGVVLGWVYWDYGLASGMLAHTLVDVLVYVVGVPSLRAMNHPLVIAELVALMLLTRWAWGSVHRHRGPEHSGEATQGASFAQGLRKAAGAGLVVSAAGMVWIACALTVQTRVSPGPPGAQPTSPLYAEPESGSTRVDARDGMVLVYVPSGEFEMGSRTLGRSERPVHRVTLDGFWIDQTEVSNGQFALCVGAGACAPPGSRRSETRAEYYGHAQYDSHPVVNVDWHQAAVYCRWAGRRLPTEAEWEKAARGVEGSMHPWGDGPPNGSLLNYDQMVGDTSAVGLYPEGASPYGALDMEGNVLEWVEDCFDYAYYRHSPRHNPKGPSACKHQHRVIRGGHSWDSAEHGWSGAADRLNDLASSWSTRLGFRCAVPHDTGSGAARSQGGGL
jgi:formylglycine-generating enzyme required for sulfatase activity